MATTSAVDVSDDAVKCSPCSAPSLAPNLGPGMVCGAHPPWHQVVRPKSGGAGPQLRVLNSLTGEKVPFIPREGNRVGWYMCGPTVYDACHMGHARSYVSMDILRRILEDYFNYEVFLQVNVTDIDDKIILRARRNKLLADYRAKAKPVAEVKADVAAAAEAFAAKLAAKLAALQVPLTDPRAEGERLELLAQQEHKVALFAAAHATIKGLVADAGLTDAAPLYAAGAEPLAEALDAELGAGVTQNEVFNAHARKYEADFVEDMASLGVRMPDALSRVTEYLPQIVEFVEAIVAKGLAYESNGSIYMDIGAFRRAGHSYPKLEPSKGKASAAEMEESEGQLSKAAAGEKRDSSDFALWKKSKAGEPSWDSPWGGGRPGWHIECSVMASDLLGPNMDVHSGGVDLQFPHHDNELCQSEARHGCAQWVNHFWHFGHLHIKGLKMSKSLKNFITIRQAIESFSPRQIRLFFLLQPWDKKIDFSDQTVGEAKTKEAALLNYFGEVKAVLRQGWLHRSTAWTARERVLSEALLRRQAAVHAALCDSFNTPAAMAELLGIREDAFAYLKERADAPDALLLKRGAMYVTKMLRIFGVVTQEDFGFPVASAAGANYEAQVGPVIDSLVSFRDQVRASAKGVTPPLASVLGLCDKLRDEAMVDLGVRLEDRAEGAVWKLDDPATLRKEVQAKLAARAEQAATKLLNKISLKTAELAKASVAAVPVAEFLRQPQFAGKYGGGHCSAGAARPCARPQTGARPPLQRVSAPQHLFHRAGTPSSTRRASRRPTARASR